MNSEFCKCGAKAETHSKDKNGKPRYRKTCNGCRTDQPYKQYRKKYCEYCGFVPLHIGQLDVDHIDGNHKNNNVENLMTLCANCHRLKTILTKGWLTTNNFKP